MPGPRELLDEDRAFSDATTLALIPDAARGRASVVAREPLVAAGIGEAVRVFAEMGCKTVSAVEEGHRSRAGEALLTIEGPARGILAAERAALNLIGHLSGVATLTARVVDRVRRVNPRCQVLATRKTLPGLRALEHAAVVAGGGAPHRADLASALLVKENHLAFVTIAEAVASARRDSPGLFLMVEAVTPQEALEVARCGADGLLLDNFAVDKIADTVELARRMSPTIVIEASGGITLENAAEYARHVDRVSLGALTHSAPAVDVALDVRTLVPGR